VQLIGNKEFRVGRWRVDQALNEISRDGTTVKLEPRTVRVLVCLAARRRGRHRRRASCESKPDDWGNQWCLSLTYDKLGRHAAAERMFEKYRASMGDAGACEYATIYAQWGNIPKALEWPETATRLRDGGLEFLRTDPLLDPVRNEPCYQAIERELKFPG
jgi:hypothetical protein